MLARIRYGDSSGGQVRCLGVASGGSTTPSLPSHSRKKENFRVKQNTGKFSYLILYIIYIFFVYARKLSLSGPRRQKKKKTRLHKQTVYT